jgi:hypothetical protein
MMPGMRSVAAGSSSNQLFLQGVLSGRQGFDKQEQAFDIDLSP